MGGFVRGTQGDFEISLSTMKQLLASPTALAELQIVQLYLRHEERPIRLCPAANANKVEC